MSFAERTVALVAAAVLFGAAYGVLRHFSPRLVEYVVEETLVQKAPPGSDPAALRTRFAQRMASLPDAGTRLENLLLLSQSLEKVQVMETAALERWVSGRAEGRNAIPRNLPGRTESK
jgi:hypothetical protein